MKNIKSLKRIISLSLCLLMLFNIVVIGTAQKAMGVSMFWTDDFENGEWNSISTDTSVFNITDFEPGAENIKYFKIENSGDKALSYKLEFEGEVSKLADVIDVYCLADVTGNVTVSQMTKIDTLSQVFSGTSVSDGKMLPEGLTGDGFYTKERYVAVALKMQDGLGNEYQNLSLGDGFTIKLTAEECEYTYDKFDVVFENTDEYLYRVGNANTVTLSSLFKAKEGAEIGMVAVTVELLDSDTNVSYVYTANPDNWADGTIQFSGTGPVKVTISDTQTYGNANSVSLNLEVVNATNVTDYSGLSNKNSVLLNDIKMTNDKISFSGVSVYGNGFTFDVTGGGISGAESNLTANYLVNLNNSNIDNIKIIGKVYTEYGATAGSDYNRPTLLSQGNSSICNSYISNCSAPVRVTSGNLEIKNTTLKGGNFANLDIRNGNVILDNVTTINQVADNDAAEDGTVVVGLGVVMYYEGPTSDNTIEIRNGIKQYNNLSKSQADEYITNSEAKYLTGEMYKSTYASVQFVDVSNDTWVHTGILSMTDAVGDINITDIDGYSDASPRLNKKDGYIHTKVPDSTSIAETAPKWSATAQGAIAPSYSFDFTNKNYVAKTEGSNDYCYVANGTVLISMDKGDTFSWDTSILTVTKYENTLPYTVTLNGTDYTGKNIDFNTAGDYVVTYTYTDPYNYTIGDGEVVKYNETYTKTLDINVSVVAPEAKNAEFTFGSNNIAGKKVTVGSDTYVMPDVSATSDTIGSRTVSGTTVYYPIIDAYTSDGKYEHSAATSWYMCFPVFKNVVTITDYAENGTGDAVVYNGSTTVLPDGLVADNPGSTFEYQAASSAPTEPVNQSGVLCYTSPTLSNNGRDAHTVVAKYIYQDNVGAIYYYFVGYKCPETKEITVCVTGDTLVTLGDGTKKRIDEVSYSDEIMVWDFYEGKYTAVNPAIIFNHEYADNTMIKLKFEDNTELKIINLHQLFDVTENDFVNVSKDTVESLVGHEFVKRDGAGYKSVKLTSYEISEENCKAYGIISSEHYNILVEDMLTTDFEPQDVGLFNYFEVGENLTFDKAKMDEDIEKYGLYTYEDFSNYLTPELFDAFNVKYMKVAVGKGQYTYEGIIGLIEKWIGNPETVDSIEAISLEPDTTEEVMTVSETTDNTVVITSGKNTVSTAGYKVTFTQNENVLTLTASGTAKSGYAIITLDGDTYHTGNIAVGESIEITVKNLDVAKDKNITVTSSWGTCNATITDNIIDLGEFKVLAERSETGVSVTLSNTTKYDVTGDVYVAVYSAGRLVSVNKLNMTATAKNDTPKLFESSLSETDKVRVFMWETGTMKPMINLIEI